VLFTLPLISPSFSTICPFPRSCSVPASSVKPRAFRSKPLSITRAVPPDAYLTSISILDIHASLPFSVALSFSLFPAHSPVRYFRLLTVRVAPPSRDTGSIPLQLTPPSALISYTTVALPASSTIRSTCSSSPYVSVVGVVNRPVVAPTATLTLSASRLTPSFSSSWLYAPSPLNSSFAYPSSYVSSLYTSSPADVRPLAYTNTGSPSGYSHLPSYLSDWNPSVFFANTRCTCSLPFATSIVSVSVP